MSEEDLFAAAKSLDEKKQRGQLCEAWFYAGMRKLLANDKAAAGSYLKKSIATEQNDFWEFKSAQHELLALEKDTPPK